MNARKILTIIVGIIIALSGLTLTISFLSNTTPDRSPTETIFVSSPTNEIASSKVGSLIAEKGSLQFGKFALLQLTTEETSLEFISAEFDAKTESLNSARARVNSGSVLAVNLLFGIKLTLLDDRIAATNYGGSFVFEKEISEEKDITRIRVLSGYAELTFVNPENSKTFEGVLLAGEEISLDNETIAEIFAAGDEIARLTAWRSKIGRFSSKFEGESRLIGKILEELPNGETSMILDFLKENLIFNSEKKEKFYSIQLAGILAAAANGDASGIDDLLATSNATKRAILQTVTARALPFTRLFVAESLSPNLKEKITRLTELNSPLTNFAGISTPSAIENLNRDLIFIFDDPENTRHTQNFLNYAKNGIDEADTASAKWLLAILKINPKNTNSDWVEAWSAINRARIIDNFDLASAIIDQLELADILVRVGRENLAGSTLKELASLLSRASTEFDESSLEMIASTGNEFRNRVLFLASLRGDSEFEEAAYEVWLAEKERLEIEEEPTEEESEATAPADDPNRVARPESELIKFLNIDFPESETQAAEEEIMEEAEISESEEDETQPTEDEKQENDEEEELSSVEVELSPTE